MFIRLQVFSMVFFFATIAIEVRASSCETSSLFGTRLHIQGERTDEFILSPRTGVNGSYHYYLNFDSNSECLETLKVVQDNFKIKKEVTVCGCSTSNVKWATVLNCIKIETENFKWVRWEGRVTQVVDGLVFDKGQAGLDACREEIKNYTQL